MLHMKCMTEICHAEKACSTFIHEKVYQIFVCFTTVTFATYLLVALRGYMHAKPADIKGEKN